MNTLRITLSVLTLAAGWVLQSNAAAADDATGELAATLTRPATAEKGPNDDGFIQRWSILEPIRNNGALTDSAIQAAVKIECFPNQLVVIPRDGEKVKVGDAELTWHAVDSKHYNVNLYHFAQAFGKPTSNVLFWAVTIVNCPEEMASVRLAIGSNAASVWWVNGQQVTSLYGDRQTVIDDGVSKRLTLKQGPNIVRCAIFNAGGATDFCARFLDAEEKPLAGFTITTETTAPAVNAQTPASAFAGPFKWKSSGVLIKPVSDEAHQLVSVKDPTFVRHNDSWHVYATTANTRGNWSIVYLNFKDWADAASAKPYYIDQNPNLQGYHCAPHLFYFRPHQKWYLVFQSQQPQYSTTDDISKPESWTKPVDFFASKPASAPRLWIDYWVICDETHAYLFFTGDDGRLYRCRTKIGDFPKGMSDPEIAINENRNILFEGGMTYKIKGMNKYLTVVEALSPSRFYRAFTADRLDGAWTPVPQADTFEKPFAGINNVTFDSGVEPWTRDISHGELVRDSNDETMTVDPNNLQLLFQGRDPASRGEYSQLPYQLGLLKLDTSSN